MLSTVSRIHIISSRRARLIQDISRHSRIPFPIAFARSGLALLIGPLPAPEAAPSVPFLEKNSWPLLSSSSPIRVFGAAFQAEVEYKFYAFAQSVQLSTRRLLDTIHAIYS